MVDSCFNQPNVFKEETKPEEIPKIAITLIKLRAIFPNPQSLPEY